jgi:phospholipid/cholesterol/gamma-HCH transport system ATP-binding protein
MIRFENIKKSFGDRTIIKGISFEITEGEIVFILGMSGTGKSVTLKNIVGLLKPDSGKIYIDDEEISSYSEEQMFPIRKKCGMVFQHPALFDSMSVFENIAFGLRRLEQLPEDEVKQRVEECLRLVNLGNISEKRPVEISYGMQKRVSLARTLALNPRILLFDEPTTGLDPITTNAINDLIKDLSRRLKTTSLVVSHDMHCALEIADRIIVLDQGQILEQGTPENLTKSSIPLVRDFLEEALEAKWGRSLM